MSEQIFERKFDSSFWVNKLRELGYPVNEQELDISLLARALRFSSFKERLERTIRAYHNRAITAAQVMEELIKIARELRESEIETERLGLTEEELAFYDALALGKEYVLSDEQLKKLAKKLVDTIRKNLSIDWAKHESV